MKREFIYLLIFLANTRVYCSSNVNAKASSLKSDAHGLKMSANDNFTVYTLDAYQFYFIHLLSGYNEADCGCSYMYSEFYVYSLAAITMHDNYTVSFVQIAENTTSKEAVLSVINVNSKYCGDILWPEVQDTIVWNKGHQEYMSIKIDPQEKYAYVFADSFILSYDLSTNLIDQFIETTNGTFWNNVQLTVRAFDLTNEWALVAGYIPFWFAKSRSESRVFLVQLQPFRFFSSSQLEGDTVSTVETLTYNREYDLSVSFDPSGLLAAIGIPRLNTVVLIQIFEYFQEDTNDEIDFIVNLDGLYASISSGLVGYGRSVAWLDDQGTLAVLVEISKNQVWSTSEVRVYSNISYVSRFIDAIPDFVLPNNQQTLGNYLNSYKPGFIQILSRFNNLLILTDTDWLLYIPTVGPGQNAVLRTFRQDLFTYVFQPDFCVSGTYKNKAGIGPCTVCPTQTKNHRNDTILVTECYPCKQTSFCPLGATDDIDLDDLPSYIQTFAYPDSPDTDNFDDLLLLNFFSFSNNIQCIRFSPLFWTILVIVVCFIVWFIMCLLKICERRGLSSLGFHRKRAKIFFKHLDVISEGERWITGLASFVVIVLIGFTCWFAVIYINLYPIEMSHDRASCQFDQYNSNFDNGLQLPLPNPDGSRWSIFDMLDSQPFSLSIDLINSPIQCRDIRVQQNRRSLLPISIPIENCTRSLNNITRYFSFNLPAHKTTVQIDIIGPYFISALRFCLHGPPNIKDKVNILHKLDVCTLFYTPNQTIGLSTDFTIKLIKVVNVTKPLSIGENVQYDGRWASTMTNDILSDKLFFEQNGQYMRYISDRTTIIIELTEESYFLQNNQKPIIRVAALSFHTLLFISLIIEIFTLIFLFYKMCCQPLFKLGNILIQTSRRKCKSQFELDNNKNYTNNDAHQLPHSTTIHNINHHSMVTTIANNQFSCDEPIPAILEIRIDEFVKNYITKLIHDGYIVRQEIHTELSERNT